MTKLFQLFKHEFIKVLPPTIFFFVAFNVIAITKALMLREHGIEFSGFLTAAVGALLVGKVVLVADKLPIVNLFPHRPLIYNVAWKTLIYVLAVLLVRYVEHLIPFIREVGDFGLANQKLAAEVVWPRFWSIQIWLIVLFFVYAIAHELTRLIGREQVMKMFVGFGENPKNQKR
jgi:hypothetical protein